MKNFIVGLALLFATTANGEHDVLEGAGDIELAMIKHFKVEMILAEQQVGSGTVMKGAMKVVDELTTCAAFWAVSEVLMKEAVAARTVPSEMLGVIENTKLVTINMLKSYVYAIQEYQGIERFNASSFMHTAEKIGNDKVQVVSDNLTGDQRNIHVVQYTQTCQPLYEMYVMNSTAVYYALQQGLTVDEIIPDPVIKGEMSL